MNINDDLVNLFLSDPFFNAFQLQTSDGYLYRFDKDSKSDKIILYLIDDELVKFKKLIPYHKCIKILKSFENVKRVRLSDKKINLTSLKFKSN
jgi:hypothetical protein